MAFNFDGVDDNATVTLASALTADMTLAAFLKPDSAGEGSNARIHQLSTTTFTYITSAGVGIQVDMATDLNFASAEGSVGDIAYGLWTPVVWIVDSTTKTAQILVGSPTGVPVETDYGTATTGVGSQVSTGTSTVLGNNAAGARTWDGGLAALVADGRKWTYPEAVYYCRTGTPPMRDTLRFWLPFGTNGTDFSGAGANATITGAVVEADPVVPGIPRRRGVLPGRYAA